MSRSTFANGHSRRAATGSLLAAALLALVNSTGHRLAAAQRGIGESMLWQDDHRLNEHSLADAGQPQDQLFAAKTQAPADALDKLRLIITRQRVDVVLAGSELMKVMNTVSTKSRAMFLADYERYFKQLQLGSTSRPMLYSYLGLQFASQQQIQAWYAPSRGRVQARILAACRALIEKRDQSVRLSREDEQLIEQARSDRENDFHLAYIVHKTNLNLFMLDSFILLCSKLEPDELADQLAGLKLAI